jgi:hypothetical protein
VAFEGTRLIARGELIDVLPKVRDVTDRRPNGQVLIFEATTSHTIEVDPRVGLTEPNEVPRGPGRPKLGVVAREVTLLPQHWDWLNSQPGGASVALRKLVHEARRANADKDAARLTQESTYRFISAVGGDLPGFEEATRALYSGDVELFAQRIAHWPADLREHALELVEPRFQD